MLDIIVIDDDQNDLRLVERVLQECKLLNPVHLLRSGKQCLEFFESKDSKRSLVFLDLMMAPLSGVSTLQQLQERSLGSGSVFVMLSGLTDIKAINTGYQLGAKTFLIKPLKPEDIIQLLNFLNKEVHVERVESGYFLKWNRAEMVASDLASLETDFFSRGVGIPT